jgi:hypothetical protein
MNPQPFLDTLQLNDELVLCEHVNSIDRQTASSCPQCLCVSPGCSALPWLECARLLETGTSSIVRFRLCRGLRAG